MTTSPSSSQDSDLGSVHSFIGKVSGYDSSTSVTALEDKQVCLEKRKVCCRRREGSGQFLRDRPGKKYVAVKVQRCLDEYKVYKEVLKRAYIEVYLFIRKYTIHLMIFIS